MLVVATGMNSEWGKTLSKLQEEAEETPLQTKLDDLAVLIGKVGMAFAALVFVVLTIYWFTGDVWGQTWEWSKIRGIVQNFIIAVTIIVVAVPEGLPLAVTISLAYSMKQMMSDANLVRHLSACETMGGATNICSDKTGTLTENRMTVVQGWVAGTEFTSIPPPSFSDPVYSLLTEGIAINSKGYIHQEPGKPVEFIGNKTECALLVFGNKLGSDYTKIREAVTVEKLFAFSSARKRMSSIVVNPAGGYRMYIKGASEIILGRCTRALGPDGTVRELSSDIRASLSQRIDEMASQGLRTLTLGFRDIEKLKNWKEPPEDDLTLIGILGIMDPIRPLVPEAVRACQFAGITVRMVTGDSS
jgi:Ca2+-transporting ATPase